MKHFRILSPDEFITMPWRNGLGTTIELTKNGLPDASGFYWRFSMADVSKDGPFSDFSGYDRTLVLLEGNGIDLSDDQGHFYALNAPLEFAQFKGEDKISASLHDGPIRDFNIMVSRDHYKASVQTSGNTRSTEIEIETDHLFLYAVNGDLEYRAANNEPITVPSGHFLIADDPEDQRIMLAGGPFIATLVKAQR